MEEGLSNIIENKTLRWIFVGGKGGVGKTTNSCALAIQLADKRESVLLISTDPAHNLSDAFAQKIGSMPTRIEPYKNLHAMEIDSAQLFNEMITQEGFQDVPLLGDLIKSFPGIDEAMGFAQIMKLIKTMEYDVIVFDTAPTGHTLRFLQFPSILEKALGKFQTFGSAFGNVFSQFSKQNNKEEKDLMSKINEMSSLVKEVIGQFEDQNLTTFICVCIAEFLSIYETERMIQELNSFNIDVRNLIVNQLLYPRKESKCSMCLAREKMQKKYLSQIDELYEDMHITKLPLLEKEVRGVNELKEFSCRFYSGSRYLSCP